MANPFVHVELRTSDPNKAREFYSRLFGWKVSSMPMPGGGAYEMIDVGQGTGGGIMQNPVPGSPSHWMAYIGVDDIKASTRKATELGASLVLDVMEVGEFGKMSVITDPTGATVGLWQEKKK